MRKMTFRDLVKDGNINIQKLIDAGYRIIDQQTIENLKKLGIEFDYSKYLPNNPSSDGPSKRKKRRKLRKR